MWTCLRLLLPKSKENKVQLRKTNLFIDRKLHEIQTAVTDALDSSGAKEGAKIELLSNLRGISIRLNQFIKRMEEANDYRRPYFDNQF